MSDFSALTDNYIKVINEELENSYKADCLMSDTLMNAMHYSLSNGGKRIRPILMLEFCKMCGGNAFDALDCACALESIHTFSLIHDDLPCMDDDDLRRGKPACHIEYGEDVALLAGDALSLDAFSKIANSKKISADKLLKVVNEISVSSGFSGMCGGQLLDLENELDRPNLEKLKLTYKLKTGKLISTACKCGAIIGGGTEEQILDAENFGYNLGLAFQIIDDVLDIEGNEEEVGKPIGSDDMQDKTTFVTLYGLEKAKQEAEIVTQKALEILNKFDNNEYLIELTKNLLIRKN